MSTPSFMDCCTLGSCSNMDRPCFDRKEFSMTRPLPRSWISKVSYLFFKSASSAIPTSSVNPLIEKLLL